MVKEKELGYFRLSAWAGRFLWRTSKFHALGYVLTSIVQVAAEVTQLWVAAMVVGTIGDIIISHASPNTLYTLIAISVGLMTLDKSMWGMLAHFERQLYLKGSADTYRMFNGQLAQLSVSQHNNSDVRRLIDRLEYEGYAWKPLNFSFSILYALHAFIRFVASSTLIIIQLPLVVLLLVVGTLPSLFIQQKSGDKGWGIWGDIGDGSRVFWGVSHHLKQKEAIEEIIPQRSAQYLLKRANEAIERYASESMRIRRRFTIYTIFGGIFEMLMASAGYIWLVTRAVAGFVTFDGFIFLSSLIWQTLSSVRLVMTQIADALYSVPFMRDFIAFTELKNNLPRSNHEVVLGNEPLTIELQNVSFTYPGQKKPALNNVSLKIHTGKHIALVGLNGAGKTTLIRLLLRFYDPSSGRILVNGTDLREIELDSYYKHIGTLFQSFNRYPLTFEDNVALEVKKNVGKYKQALDIAGANTVLHKLPSEKTYLSPDFTDGADLSGGEWQRVAIARNLYAGGDIFILDEPTSAIDALAEQEIFEKLYKELKGKVLITVSHRFNTVRKADVIIVLRDGFVSEQGTHDALMKLGGLYHEMFTAQAEGYGE